MATEEEIKFPGLPPVDGTILTFSGSDIDRKGYAVLGLHAVASMDPSFDSRNFMTPYCRLSRERGADIFLIGEDSLTGEGAISMLADSSALIACENGSFELEVTTEHLIVPEASLTKRKRRRPVLTAHFTSKYALHQSTLRAHLSLRSSINDILSMIEISSFLGQDIDEIINQCISFYITGKLTEDPW